MKNGLYCSGGHDYVAIGSNGDVAPCNAFARTPKYALGNLFTDARVTLRGGHEFFRCPIQECHLPCDRHWARKQVWEGGELADTQDIHNPVFRAGKARPLTFLWAPTWKCNYDCAYCDLPVPKDERPAADWVAAFGRFFDANGIDGGLAEITGGEPLFYKDIGSVFTFLTQRGFMLQVTTNLSGDVQNALVRAATPDKFTVISCSLHPSVKHFRWEQFRGRVLSLKAYGYNVAVNFVGHPDQVMLAPEYHAFFAEHGVPLVLIPMEGEFNGVKFGSIWDYPPDMQDVFAKIAPEWVKGANRFKEGKRTSLPMLNESHPRGWPASVWKHFRKLLTPRG
ncbi:MAG TPA: hypothetical protein VGE74_06440 [Gemmata sp.]